MVVVSLNDILREVYNDSGPLRAPKSEEICSRASAGHYHAVWECLHSYIFGVLIEKKSMHINNFCIVRHLSGINVKILPCSSVEGKDSQKAPGSTTPICRHLLHKPSA